jgi:hypothetical protein
MKNFKIWVKLALLAGVFMVPFVIVTATLLSTVKEQVDFAQGELTGVDYAVPLLKLADDLRTHRAVADRLGAGQPLQAELESSGVTLRSDLGAVDAVYARKDGEEYGRGAGRKCAPASRTCSRRTSPAGRRASTATAS